MTMRRTLRSDPDFIALRKCVRALESATTPKMQRATLEYLWDRFVMHPKPVKAAGLRAVLG